MAEEEKKGEENAEAPKKGGKKKLIIIGAVVLVVIIGVVLFLVLGGSKGEGEEGHGEDGAEGAAAEEGAEEGEEGAEGELPGAIIPLETFIVNLQVKGSFLKTTVQLEVSQPAPPAEFESDIPKVRDSIIRVLSSKTSAEILTVEGKEKLREEIKDAVNEALQSEDVVQVYFTDFIVQ